MRLSLLIVALTGCATITTLFEPIPEDRSGLLAGCVWINPGRSSACRMPTPEKPLGSMAADATVELVDCDLCRGGSKALGFDDCTWYCRTGENCRVECAHASPAEPR